MQLEISGQHLSMGASLQEYVKTKLTEVVHKYFEKAPSAHVHLSKQGHEFVCDIVVKEGTGRNMVIKSNANSGEIYHTCDLAFGKIEKQMQKYKAKLNSHHNQPKLSEISPDTGKNMLDSSIDEMDE